MLNAGGGEFRDAKRINSGEAVESGTALAVGDLNRDGRDDLALLESNELVLVYQDAKGQARRARAAAAHREQSADAPAVDLDGDGGDDLVILDGGTDDPIRVRFSAEGGKLGPEQRFQVESPKAIAFAQIDGKPGVELLTIESQSGRGPRPDPRRGREGRPGQGRPVDLLSAPPRQRAGPVARPGRPRRRRQGRRRGDRPGQRPVPRLPPVGPDRAWGRARASRAWSAAGPSGWPTSTATARPRSIVLSEQEKQIGRSRPRGRPAHLPRPPADQRRAGRAGRGRPRRRQDARGPLRHADRRRDGSDTYRPPRPEPREVGDVRPVPLGPGGRRSPLKGISSVPPAVRVLDVNRDGQADVLVFNASGPPMLLLGPTGRAPRAGRGKPRPARRRHARRPEH